MKLIFNKTIFFLLFFYTNIFSVHIKVLLNELPLNKFFNLNLKTSKSIRVRSFQNPKKYANLSNNLNVSYKNGYLILNGKILKLDDKLILEPVDDCYIELDGSKYQGQIILIPVNNNYLIINRLNLEDYTYSVLKTESWPGWPLETNLVLAVACRSYAMAKIVEANKKKLFYHIKPTNHHQTYSGYHENFNLKKAVEQTSGLIMSYNKKPILAMFDSCCGGVVPSKMKNIAYTPYLARDYACIYCKDFKIHNWDFEINKSELVKILKTQFKGLKTLSDLRILNDKAGLVEKILIKDGRRSFYLQGKKLYSLLKDVKSFCFDILHLKEKNKFVFKGKGYGHHIGLCQWGAYQMTKSGQKYKDVLKFFYPNIEFMRIV